MPITPQNSACPRCGGDMLNGQFFGTLPFQSDAETESSLLKRWLRGFTQTATVMVSAMGCRCETCGYTVIHRDSVQIPDLVTVGS
jgi:hypothetical protein